MDTIEGLEELASRRHRRQEELSKEEMREEASKERREYQVIFFEPLPPFRALVTC